MVAAGTEIMLSMARVVGEDVFRKMLIDFEERKGEIKIPFMIQPDSPGVGHRIGRDKEK